MCPELSLCITDSSFSFELFCQLEEFLNFQDKIESENFLLNLIPIYCITSKKTAKRYMTLKYFFVEYFGRL